MAITHIHYSNGAHLSSAPPSPGTTHHCGMGHRSSYLAQLKKHDVVCSESSHGPIRRDLLLQQVCSQSDKASGLTYSTSPALGGSYTTLKSTEEKLCLSAASQYQIIGLREAPSESNGRPLPGSAEWACG